MSRIPDTQLAAFRTTKLSERQQLVMRKLRWDGPMTDTELSAATRMPINSVCSARNSLMKLNVVHDSGERRKSAYGKENIVWALGPAPQQAEPEARPVQGQLQL